MSNHSNESASEIDLTKIGWKKLKMYPVQKHIYVKIKKTQCFIQNTYTYSVFVINNFDYKQIKVYFQSE